MEKELEQFERYLNGRLETIAWEQRTRGYTIEESVTEVAFRRALETLHDRDEKWIGGEYLEAYNRLNDEIRQEQDLRAYSRSD